MTCFTTSLFKMMALSDSLVAYTAYCDQLSELGPLVERVANKHVSLGVQPEHYPVVGVTLLGALEVLINGPFFFFIIIELRLSENIPLHRLGACMTIILITGCSGKRGFQ